MKPYLLYSIVFFTLMSCARARHEKHSLEAAEATEYDDAIEATDIPYQEEIITAIPHIQEGYTMVIKEKLQEYLDQKALAQTHPDFKTSPSAIVLDSLTLDSIQHITFISPFEKISDSVSKVQTRITFYTAIADTLFSYITTATVRIENKTYTTSKITFKKE